MGMRGLSRPTRSRRPNRPPWKPHRASSIRSPRDRSFCPTCPYPPSQYRAGTTAGSFRLVSRASPAPRRHRSPRTTPPTRYRHPRNPKRRGGNRKRPAVSNRRAARSRWSCSHQADTATNPRPSHSAGSRQPPPGFGCWTGRTLAEAPFVKSVPPSPSAGQNYRRCRGTLGRARVAVIGPSFARHRGAVERQTGPEIAVR